jgi:hypothetical protein
MNIGASWWSWPSRVSSPRPQTTTTAAAAAHPWGAQTRFPSAPGCSWRPSTRCVDPTCWSSAGPLLDSAASSCRSLPTRLRGRCPRSLMSGTTIMDKPLPALRALSWGLFRVCRQTTGLDQRPECDHAAGDRCGTLGRRRPGFPSDFPPPNMGLRETGRNGRGRPVTAEAVDRPFVHVTSGLAGQVGLERDWRRAADATCKIAGIAYTGSNPVPATLPLSCGNAAAYRPVRPDSMLRFPSTRRPADTAWVFRATGPNTPSITRPPEGRSGAAGGCRPAGRACRRRRGRVGRR